VPELIESKMPLMLCGLPDQGRSRAVLYACFARCGFADAARQLMDAHQGLLVDLEMLDHELP